METEIIPYPEKFFETVVYLWFNIEEQPVFGWAWGIHKPFKFGRMSLMAEIRNEDRDELIYNMHNGKPYEVHKPVRDERPDKYNPKTRLHTFNRMTIIIEAVKEDSSYLELSMSRAIRR